MLLSKQFKHTAVLEKMFRNRGGASLNRCLPSERRWRSAGSPSPRNLCTEAVVQDSFMLKAEIGEPLI